MTETGAIMGTAAYLSPEQAQGHAVSASSDLYSVGILLYELLTGAPPFDAESAVTIALKQVSRGARAAALDQPRRVARSSRTSSCARCRRTRARASPTPTSSSARSRPCATTRAARRRASGPGTSPASTRRSGLYDEEVEAARERRTWRFWAMVALVLLALAAIGAGLFLLLRPKEVRVPKVVGQTSRVASTRLNNQGFEVQLTQLRNPDVPEDIVSRQRPGPGEKVDKGSTVTIYVSSGPGQADVPDVVGQTEKAARRAIEKAGFEVDVERAFSETVKSGRVIDTRPSAQTQIDLGKPVTLIVSKGPGGGRGPRRGRPRRGGGHRAAAGRGLRGRLRDGGVRGGGAARSSASRRRAARRCARARP